MSEFGEHHDAMTTPGPPVTPGLTRPGVKCRNVTVTTGDGRVFNLGPPTHRLLGARLFEFRVRRYKKKRAAELAAADDGGKSDG